MPEYRRYHDEEWGREQHDPRALYEKLCLEGFQAGLSWITILRRRPAFREVFYDFEPERVASMTETDVARLLLDERIIRHRGKIEATISNARATLALDVGLDGADVGLRTGAGSTASERTSARSRRSPSSRPR